MKLKEGFILREVAGQTVVLPSGDELNLNLMITLNSTGGFLWKQLETEKDEAQLIAALRSEYDVDEDTAAVAVTGFVAKLKENGFLVF